LASDSEEAVTNALDELIVQRYQDALHVHRELGIELCIFAEHLRRIASRYLGSFSAPAAHGFIASLHTSDLILSLACARGDDAAWRRFCELYRNHVESLTRNLMGRRSDPEELCDALWVDLFLPDSSGNSRIASYDGRSSLATWLRVVVNNRVINELQRKNFRWTTLDVIREPSDPPALRSVEARVSCERYQQIIYRSFEYASRRLTSDERTLLLLRYDKGYQLGHISRMYSVHQSTITRQLDKIVGRFRTDVVSMLTYEYRMGSAAVEECMNVACGTFSTSMSILNLLAAAGTDHGD
jgi:RNA polymerase sigma-70 factor